MTSRTLAFGAAHTRLETSSTDNVIIVSCTVDGCDWHHNFRAYPGRGVLVDNVILEMNMHASKEH